ncbi:hypothetical protein LUZ62_033716 [Rhynchospora pubera]|uniref:CDC20/Fizzy WD40 domain-containing protein n=1 Tax=Rhynchospora pubera TaxID=906938 RepID=A0AAV8DGU8_9POAL|nr:hypothetical protein LUZ62_078808 [Rhynchospora pubera]KAJ4821150.1 hypothetical protein LUZ62_033716 [Rhynchospora pubera]
MDASPSFSTNGNNNTIPVMDLQKPDFSNLVHHWCRPARASSHDYADRFIPNRAATNMDLAQGLLTIPRKEDSMVGISPSREAYRKLLVDTLLQGRTRIFKFRNQPRTPKRSFLDLPPAQPIKKQRRIPHHPEESLDVQDIICNRQLNLLDWGSNNILAVAVNDTVYLWNATTKSVSELVTVDDPITSVSWDLDCRRIAIGLNNSHVQLYDPATNKMIRTLQGNDQDVLVGSLAWNNYLLTTGSADGLIINNDVRIRSPIVSTYDNHSDGICGLKWSPSGQYLASGGADKLVHIWDISKSDPLHRINDHTASVRALAWCPFQSNLLASGGGKTDESIKFWNASTGACLKSVNTGSEVSGLLWNKSERELVSSHGRTKNQLVLWKYPSMAKMAELIDHLSPVLYLAQSPDGCQLASASKDETLKIWRTSKKLTNKTTSRTSFVVGPCNMYSSIR